MKRSEVNDIIRLSIAMMNEKSFALPPWAYWKPEQWKNTTWKASEIFEHKLGWDITDFGCGEFLQKGLTLFTIRNGSLQKKGKKYCEKIMVVEELQETPLHFHWNKTEDIINRGGGNLVMELFMADENENPRDQPLDVSMDGIVHRVEAGSALILQPGQSITLEPYMYHRFYGEKGKGRVLVGEVSVVNDDSIDNRFYEDLGRFPEIEEDVPPLHLLVNDYPDYI